ncbi:MAG: FtsX-like permease family protein [Planctomycetota bacterium]
MIKSKQIVQFVSGFSFLLSLLLVFAVSESDAGEIINVSRVSRHIGELSGETFDSNGNFVASPSERPTFSRMPGYAGHKKAEQYIRSELAEYSRAALDAKIPVLTGEQTFLTPALIDEEFANGEQPRRLQVVSDPQGRAIEPFMIRALWANGVTTCAIDPENPLEGPLTYAGDGTYRSMNDRIIPPKPGAEPYKDGYYPGAIVVMEYASADNWTRAASLGAQAVLFLEPQTAADRERVSDFETKNKHLITSLDFKRYYVPEPDASRLRTYLTTDHSGVATGKDIANYPVCRMTYRMRWEARTPVKNLWMYIPGIGERETNPGVKAKDELVVLNAHYDSYSIVPSLAPGADQAMGAAMLLDLARYMLLRTSASDAAPEFGNLPERSLLILFNAAHHNSLQGVREFFRVEADSYRLLKRAQAANSDSNNATALKALTAFDLLNDIFNTLRESPASDDVWLSLGLSANLVVDEERTEFAFSKERLRALMAAKTGASSQAKDIIDELTYLNASDGSADDIRLDKLFAFGDTPNMQAASPLYRRSVQLLRRLIAIDRSLALLTEPNFADYLANVQQIEKTDANRQQLLEKGVAAAVKEIAPAPLSAVRYDETIAEEIMAERYIESNGKEIPALFKTPRKPGEAESPNKAALDIAKYFRDVTVEILKEGLEIEETYFDRRLAIYRRRDIDAPQAIRASRISNLLKNDVNREYVLRYVRYRLNRLPKYNELVKKANGGVLDEHDIDEGLTRESIKRNIDAADQLLAQIIERKRAELLAVRNELLNESAVIQSNFDLYCLLAGRRPTGTGAGEVKYGKPVSGYLGLDITSGSSLVGQFFAGGLWSETNSPSVFYRSFASDVQSLQAKVEIDVARLTIPSFTSTNPNRPSGSAHCVDTFNFSDRTWTTFFPVPPPFDGEVSTMAGLRGYTVATAFDSRPLHGTPLDRFGSSFYLAKSSNGSASDDDLNRRNRLAHQAAYVGPYALALLNAKFLTSDPRIENNPTVGWTEIYGSCVQRTGNDIQPRSPVRNALIQGRGSSKRVCGVLPTFLTASDTYGEYAFIGPRRRDIRIFIEAFQVDALSGGVIMAENIGGVTENMLSKSHYCTATNDYMYDVKIQMFPSRGIALMELVDPRFLMPLKEFDLIDARSNTTPLQWSASAQVLGEDCRVFYLDPDCRMRMLFLEGAFGIRMALLNMPAPIVDACRTHQWARADNPNAELMIEEGGRMRSLSIDDARGDGFNPRRTPIITNPSLQAATDYWTLNHVRMDMLRKRNIENGKLNLLHDATGAFVHDIAPKAVEDLKYDEFYSASRTAWGTESRAYPDVMATANDTVTGVLFYLFLLVPFCYFLERLLIGSIRIEYILINVAGIFILMFLLLWAIHPAFDLVSNPLLILLAFIILVLSVVVTLLVYGKFNTEMKYMRMGGSGEQSAEVNQSSAAFLAVTLGINNMRKRKIRTALTCLTVIILTFTALSFTSVVHSVKNTGVSRPYTPKYDGIYMRNVRWNLFSTETLEERFRRGLTLTDETTGARQVIYSRPWLDRTTREVTWEYKTFATGETPAVGFEPARKAMVFPRYWSLPALITDVKKFDVVRETPGRESAVWTIDHIVGLSADEGWQTYGPIFFHDTILPNTTPIRKPRYSADSATDARFAHSEDPAQYRLFSSDDALECVIPHPLAERLGMRLSEFSQVHQMNESVGDEDVRAAMRRDKLSIQVGGRTLMVVGVFNAPNQSTTLVDNILDLDNEMITPVNLSGEKQATATATDAMDAGSAAEISFEHYVIENTIVVPVGLARVLGCSQRALSIRHIITGESDAGSDVATADDARDPLAVDEVGRRLDALLMAQNSDYREQRRQAADRNERLTPIMRETEDLLMRMEQNLWIGNSGSAWIYASTGKVGITGWGNLFVPLLISALIILNVMIGAVHERSREIGIFSALGLSPSHIGWLFLAESIVYATIGGMAGYIIGQGIAGVINHFDLLPGLTLNFSSLSTVFVTAIVMTSVIASTLYPATLASKIAVPSSDMRWGVPTPVGDRIDVDLPFSFQEHIIPGISQFMYSYFSRHVEASVGAFNVKRITLETFETDKGPGLRMYMMTWLTPYDLGVSQEVQMIFEPQGGGLYFTKMTFHRVSGDVKDWQRVNLPFLNVMRRQFLLWRTYSAEQRAEYAYNGFVAFRDAFVATGFSEPEKPAASAAPAAAAATVAPAAGTV